MAFANENARFSITLFPTDYSMQPPELARAVEERGFDGLFFPEHTHIPASRTTPFPGGGDLPKQYWHTHDPFVALAFAASAASFAETSSFSNIAVTVFRNAFSDTRT